LSLTDHASSEDLLNFVPIIFSCLPLIISRLSIVKFSSTTIKSP